MSKTKTSVQIGDAVREMGKSLSGSEAATAARLSGGDVRRMVGYRNVQGCVRAMHVIAHRESSPQLAAAANALSVALGALEANAGVFRSAYTTSRENGRMVRLIYTGAVMSVWGSVALLCAKAVTSDPQCQIPPKVDKKGLADVTGSVIYRHMLDFGNKSGQVGFSERLSEGLLRNVEVDGLQEVAWAAAMIPVGVLALSALLLSLTRDVVEYFMSSRGTLSRWLDMQAGFLEGNAHSLDPGPDSGVIRERQLKSAKRLRDLAARVAIDYEDAARGIPPSQTQTIVGQLI